jgi:hypothetical protein
MDCLAKCASLGPLFEILSAGDANSIFGAFGEAFHEYSASIFGAMFPSSPSLSNRAMCPFLDKDGNEITDACLDYNDAAILFETKSVFIDKAAERGNPDEYLEELEEKYVSGEERRQGIAQIADAIKSLAEGSREPSQLRLDQVKLMLPVMLVRDPLMDSPLHPIYLAEQFAEALVPDSSIDNGNMMKGHFYVTQLIVMTIETLEDLESSGMDLRKLLVDYSAACPDRVLSLRNFLALSDYQGQIRYSERLREEATQQIESLKSYF